MVLSAGSKCEHCGGGGALHVHHLTYKNVTREKPEDVIVLCERCHTVIEAVILDRKHERKGPADQLRKFTHRRLRMAGIAMINGPRHKPNNLEKWAERSKSAVDRFLYR